MIDKERVKRLEEAIKILTDIRDKIMEDGGGHTLPDQFFDTIDRLYGELLEELGYDNSKG